MKDIKDIISSLKNIHDPKNDKEIVNVLIKEVCGFDIDQKNIDFVGDSLKLKISSPEKNVIFMSQDKILKTVNEKLKDRGIKRIN